MKQRMIFFQHILEKAGLGNEREEKFKRRILSKGGGKGVAEAR